MYWFSVGPDPDNVERVYRDINSKMMLLKIKGITKGFQNEGTICTGSKTSEVNSSYK
jgi:hypothetical protein